jgi:DNA polymerase III epsilon subunit family exonuclease
VVAEALWQQPFVAFDTETTGLGANARIIEVGAVRFVGPAALAAFQQLVAPGIPVSPGAQAIHGLSDTDLAQQPPAALVLPAFFAFVADTPLLAHNAPFDLSMLAHECMRLGLAPPPNPVFDTRHIAQAVGLSVNGYSLSALVQQLGLSASRLHRALADAEATWRVFLASLARAPWVRTLDDLIALAGPPRTIAEFMGVRPALPPALRCLEERLGRPVLICYGGGSKGTRPRPITPQALFAQGDAVYIEAHCHLDGVVKVFRADRILSAEPLDG